MNAWAVAGQHKDLLRVSATFLLIVCRWGGGEEEGEEYFHTRAAGFLAWEGGSWASPPLTVGYSASLTVETSRFDKGM